jgi:hypothetical protein
MNGGRNASLKGTALLALVAAVVVIAAVVALWPTKISIMPAPPTSMAGRIELPRTSSHLSVAVDCPKTAIAASLETAIPKVLKVDLSRDGARAYGSPSREPLQVAIETQASRLSVSTQVLGHVQVEKRVKIDLLVGHIDQLASVGIDVSGNISVAASPAIARNWTITPQSALTARVNKAVAHIKIPLVGDIGVDVMGHVQGAVDDALKGAKEATEAKLKESLDVRKHVEPVWNQMNAVHKLADDPPTWLVITPRHVTFAGFHYGNDAIMSGLDLGLDTDVFVQDDAPEVAKVPLPELHIGGAVSDEFELSIPIEISYDALNERIRAQLPKQPLSLPHQASVELRGATVASYRDGVVVTIDFIGKRGRLSASGKLYIVGLPVFDVGKSELRLEHVDFSSETKSLLLKVANWLAHATILNAIESAAVFKLDTQLKRAIERANLRCSHGQRENVCRASAISRGMQMKTAAWTLMGAILIQLVGERSTLAQNSSGSATVAEMLAGACEPYLIISRYSGMAIDAGAPGPGRTLRTYPLSAVAYPLGGRANRDFCIELIELADERFVTFVVQRSTLAGPEIVLDVVDAAKRPRNVRGWQPPVQTARRNGQPNQQFKFSQIGGGFVTIKARHSNWFLEVAGSGGYGATVQTSPVSNQPSQHWVAVPLSSVACPSIRRAAGAGPTIDLETLKEAVMSHSLTAEITAPISARRLQNLVVEITDSDFTDPELSVNPPMFKAGLKAKVQPFVVVYASDQIGPTLNKGKIDYSSIGYPIDVVLIPTENRVEGSLRATAVGVEGKLKVNVKGIVGIFPPLSEHGEGRGKANRIPVPPGDNQNGPGPPGWEYRTWDRIQDGVKQPRDQRLWGWTEVLRGHKTNAAVGDINIYLFGKPVMHDFQGEVALTFSGDHIDLADCWFKLDSAFENGRDYVIEASGFGGGIAQDLVDQQIRETIRDVTSRRFVLRGGCIVPE